MLRSACLSARRPLLAAFAVAAACLAPAGCGLDRSGLEGSFGGGGSSPSLDAAFDTISVIAEGGRSGAGAGGSPVDGIGGISGSGGGSGAAGVMGAGGSGTGGFTAGGTGGRGIGGGSGVGGRGTGGAAVGTGGTIGVGGMLATGGTGGGAPCPTCAPCERCSSAGTCEIDPQSRWDLSVVSATLNPADPHNQPSAGTAWDGQSEVGGLLPDPFCELDVPFVDASGDPAVEVIGLVPAIADTLAPNWSTAVAPALPLLHPAGEPIRAGDLLAGGRPWVITIGDDDQGSLSPSGETMCQIEGPLETSDFRAGGFMRANVGSCFTANFKLLCHP